MFNFICKSSLHLKHSFRNIPTHNLYFLQLKSLSVDALKPTSENAKDESFTVNYFIKRCGFAPEKAISASKYVNFDKRPDKPEVVIAFLKNQGFTETQVLKLIRSYPPVVTCDHEKTILPKIEFFLSHGVSKSNLPAILVAVPAIVRLSLDRNIIPSINLLEKYLGSFEKALGSILRWPGLLWSFQHNAACNIEILRQAGIPKAFVRNVLTHWAISLGNHPDKFKEVVEEVRKMGVDPLKSTFLTAVHVILGLSRSSWKKKMEVYKKWGCSEDEVLAAFFTNPWCMSISNDKIEGVMGYFVNEMGWDPSMLMKRSRILSMSLNQRIIPRCSVYRVLLSKGLIKECPSLFSLLILSEEKFCKRCLEHYEKEDLELLKLYQEKMKLSKVTNIQKKYRNEFSGPNL